MLLRCMFVYIVKDVNYLALLNVTLRPGGISKIMFFSKSASTVCFEKRYTNNKPGVTHSH